MCTVIVRVPEDPSLPTRIVAVRDEDPTREWNPPGHWWPEAYPGVVGVRDVRAGGAWLAVDESQSRLAVILNRREVPGATASRGRVVLEAVAGRPPRDTPDTNGFNLVVVDDQGTHVTSWDGDEMRESTLRPGVHMIAHDEVDDDATPRIARWLPEFAAVSADDDEAWEKGSIALLERTAALPPTDDRAIVRDNRPYGVPTLSLLVCTASIGGGSGVDLAYGELDEPGLWNHPHFSHPH
jgi:uncharacterized protein with NRDE domain